MKLGRNLVCFCLVIQIKPDFISSRASYALLVLEDRYHNYLLPSPLYVEIG